MIKRNLTPFSGDCEWLGIFMFTCSYCFLNYSFKSVFKQTYALKKLNYRKITGNSFPRFVPSNFRYFQSLVLFLQYSV